MSAADARPGVLDVLFRPGNSVVLQLTWPSTLSGRTFTAAVGGTPADVVVSGSTITVTVAATATAALTGAADWVLNETTTGVPVVVVAGTWYPFATGSQSQVTAVNVSVASTVVNVTVLGPPGPAGTGGTGTGAVASVNGHTGTVVLTYTDVGADAAGAAASEATARATAVTNEATARAAADTTLQTNITAEATARAAADTAEASARAAAVTAEASTRAAADLALVPLDGSRPMTGALVLPGNAGTNLQATPLQQVNSLIATAISQLVNGAPGILDTLGEIAAALQADESTAAALATTVAGKLAKASNLADLIDAAAARTNLGLGSAALLASAAVLQVANNLSDVGNAATARTNLGLGSAATQASSAFDVAGAAAAVQALAALRANNLADLASAATARTNLGLAAIAASGSGGDLGAGTVANAALANMAQATFKMRAAGAGSGAPIDGTVAQAKTALAIAATDLTATGTPSSTTILYGDNTWKTAPTGGGLTLLAHGESTVSVTNTTSETDLLNVTLPTDLKAGDRLRIIGEISATNTSGSTVTFNPKVRLGSTVIVDPGVVNISISNSSFDAKGRFEFEVVVISTGSEDCHGQWLHTNGSSVGFNTINASNTFVGRGTATEDLTVAKTLRVTVTPGTATANATYRLHSYAIHTVAS